ncbi:Uncharacterised protein [uncultured archaeon]|nr:Uncharacterised protein [uncultured archaeon]
MSEVILELVKLDVELSVELLVEPIVELSVEFPVEVEFKPELALALTEGVAFTLELSKGVTETV